MNSRIFIIITIITFTSCGDSNDYIQNVYVDIDIDLSLPEFSELVAFGNSVFIKGGNKGIIIYHFADKEYRIYDRNCSYEPSLECSQIDSISSTIAYCGCCTSAFLLDQDGIAANDPAIEPLKGYSYELKNNLLKIYN